MTQRLTLLVLCVPLMLGAAARNFDGTNDELDYGNVVNVTTGDVTVCAWMKIPDNAVSDFIFGKANDVNANTAGYHIGQFSGDQVYFRCGDGVANCGGTSPRGSAYLGTAWLWMCGSWDATGEVAKAFYNSAEVDSRSGTAVGSLSNAVNLQMGETPPDVNDLTGDLAYGTIYSLLITPDMQTQLMWLPESLPPGVGSSSREGFWPLWGASPEQDLSGNGRTGTVSNAGTSTDGPPVMFGGGLPL